MLGYCHSSETFGTVDGPGIRYVLFLSGCSMTCAFCHNPDTWSRGRQTITVEAVLQELQKYRSYYEASGGGITVSGGEPLLQAEFVAELFQACRKQGIHTILDTAGYCPRANIDIILPYTQAVLFCLKVMDKDKHHALTGVDNQGILENCRYLADRITLTIRYVVLPGVNNSESDISQLAHYIQSLSRPVAVELLGYHVLGREKWAKLGMAYPLDTVPPAREPDLQAVRKLLTGQGIQVLYENAKA